MISQQLAREIRDFSRGRAALNGIRLPAEPPPLLSTFPELVIRPLKVLVDRALVLYAILCIVFEPESKQDEAKNEAANWLSRFDLTEYLTDREVKFLEGVDEELFDSEYEVHVETLHSIAWVIGIVDDLNPAADVSDSFGSIFPNIQKGTSPAYLYRKSLLRPADEVIKEFDFYYCLHWLSVETKLKELRWPLPVERCVIRQRRFGLEWALSTEHWDDLTLDT